MKNIHFTLKSRVDKFKKSKKRKKNVNETTIVQNVIGKERSEVYICVYAWVRRIETNNE